MSNGTNHREDYEVSVKVRLLLGWLISHYEHTSDSFDSMDNDEVVFTLKEIEELLNRLEFLEFNYGHE